MGMPETLLVRSLQQRRPLILRFDIRLAGARCPPEEVRIEARIASPVRQVHGQLGTPLTIAVNAGETDLPVNFRFLRNSEAFGVGVVNIASVGEAGRQKWTENLAIAPSCEATMDISILDTGRDPPHSLPATPAYNAPRPTPRAAEEPEFSESLLIAMLNQSQSPTRMRESTAPDVHSPAGTTPLPIQATPAREGRVGGLPGAAPHDALRWVASPTIPHGPARTPGVHHGLDNYPTPNPHRLPVTATSRPRPKADEHLPREMDAAEFNARQKVAQLRLAKARLAVSGIPKLAAWQPRLFERSSDLYDTETAQRTPLHTTFCTSGTRDACATALDDYITWLLGEVASPGTSLDELVGTLRTNLPGEGDKSLSDADRRRAVAEELACVAHLFSLSEVAAVRYSPPLEFMEHIAMRLLTQRPEDVDRDFGWTDVPPLGVSDEPSSFTRARELYGLRHTDWGYTMRPPYRNGSFLVASPKTLPKMHAAAVGVCRTREAELWRAVPLTPAAPATPPSHFSAGDVFMWQYLSLAQRDRAEAEARLTGHTTPAASLLLFRIIDPTRTACLVPYTSYASPDYLLSPLMRYRVDEVDTDANVITVTCLPGDSSQMAALEAAIRADILRSSERLQKAVKRLELAWAFGYSDAEVDNWCAGQLFFADPPPDTASDSLVAISDVLGHLPDVPCSVAGRLAALQAVHDAETATRDAQLELCTAEAAARWDIASESQKEREDCYRALLSGVDREASIMRGHKQQLHRDLAFVKSDTQRQLHDATLDKQRSLRSQCLSMRERMLPFHTMRAHMSLISRCFARLAGYRARQLERCRNVELLWRRHDFWTARVCYGRWEVFRNRRATRRRGMAVAARAGEVCMLWRAWGRWERFRHDRRSKEAEMLIRDAQSVITRQRDEVRGMQCARAVWEVHGEEVQMRRDIELREARDRAEMEGWWRGFRKAHEVSAARIKRAEERSAIAFHQIYELLAPLTDTLSTVDSVASATSDAGEHMAMRAAAAAVAEVTKLRRLCQQTHETAVPKAVCEPAVASPCLSIETAGPTKHALAASFDALRELKFAILDHRDCASEAHGV